MTATRPMTLVVLAAGLGSRSGGPKQIEGLGPSGETITDYSIYDALRAGFTKAVLIVREEILEKVQEVFRSRWSDRIALDFVIQSMDRCVPAPFRNLQRTRPWGTGHALLCARDAVHEPCAVINADDLYGREAFQALAYHFANDSAGDHAMVGFQLRHVLSSHGSVSRGCGKVDPHGLLTSLIEHRTIKRDGEAIVSELPTGNVVLDPTTPTSMNCWGFHPTVFGEAERAFSEFLENHHGSADAEFYIPVIVDHMLQNERCRVKVLPTDGCTWFGVTYKEDKPAVAQRLRTMVDQGLYPERLG